LVTDRNFVQLDPQSITTDVAEFESTLQLASQALDRSAQIAHLAQAVEGYHGVLLPGFYEEWIVPESQRWRRHISPYCVASFTGWNKTAKWNEPWIMRSAA
jgi:two-component SAPR family response regulator